MSDDEVVPVVLLGDDGEPVPEPTAAERTPTHWTRVVVAVSAAVGALALCVIALAERDQAREQARQRCMQEAQVLAFGPRSGEDQFEVFRDRLAACGVEVPTEQ